MSEISNSAKNNYAYSVHDGDALINQVAKVICVLLPRALATAGFSERGELLTVRYGDYSPSQPEWVLDFFEHRFVDEPLLARPELVQAVVVASDKYLVVPETLYDEQEAVHWLKKLFFVEGSEVTATYALQGASARYVYAYPGSMKSLVERYFQKAKLLPLATHQFNNTAQTDIIIQCSLTQENAIATLHQHSRLLWHQVFEYETAEDIAFQLRHLCVQRGMDAETVAIEWTTVHPKLNTMLRDAAQYFPYSRQHDVGMISGDDEWRGTISLLQQLYACAL